VEKYNEKSRTKARAENAPIAIGKRQVIVIGLRNDNSQHREANAMTKCHSVPAHVFVFSDVHSIISSRLLDQVDEF